MLVLTAAFSAVPLMLYIPPLRSLNQFVETIEDMERESRIYTSRIFPHLHAAWTWLINCILCSTR